MKKVGVGVLLTLVAGLVCPVPAADFYIGEMNPTGMQKF